MTRTGETDREVSGSVAEGAVSGKTGGRLRPLVELGVVILAVVALSSVLRIWVVQTYSIPSCSMAPTLLIGDRIEVNKLSYHLHDVHRGDVVVFSRPPAELNTTITDLVKRVIGLPGDTISSVLGGPVLINGKPLDEPWLTGSARAFPGPPIRAQTVPAGQYFVMGDNRPNSQDSRFFGTIPGTLLVGHAQFRIWPPSRVGELGSGAAPTSAAVTSCPLR